MDPSQWLASFRVTHEKARRGELKEAERKTYLAMRDELARSLMAAANQPQVIGQRAGRVFSIAHVFPIEIAGLYKTMTREISCRGFIATVPALYDIGDTVKFALTTKRGAEPITGEAKITAVLKQTGNATRITAGFTLGELQLEALEHALFDAAMLRYG